MELGKIIDDNSEDDNTTSNINHTNKNGGEALSKGGILEKVSELFQREMKSSLLLNFPYCFCRPANTFPT